MLTDDERLALRDIADRLDHLTHSKLIAEQSAKLRAIAAPRVATVGELLATAPVGEIIEWRSSTGRGWWQLRVLVSGNGVECRTCADGWSWCGWRAGQLIAGDMPRPGRLIPADQADLDPSTRGPIGEG